MHESFFGLQKRPFLTYPTLERYCPVACQEQAFQVTHRAISRAEGPVAVLGGTGLGKSMVCLRIAENFRRSFEVILLSSSQICSRRALLQSLLFELRMPYRDLSEGELRLSLLDRLQPSNENASDGLVLIVDEAQTLSIKLLDELRMITNLTRDGQPRVRLVLCGTHRLDEMLGHPQLESLNQRLAARSYLSPLNQAETINYLTHKVERCGVSIRSVMTEESMQLIHRATDGVPRLIDQLADQSLRLAFETHQRPCSGSTIESAWASLQQLPVPWSDTSSPIESEPSSIEFGALEEDTDNEFSTQEANHLLPSGAFSQQTFSDQSNYSTQFCSSESTVDRNVFFPVPSAGMGLSGVSLPSPPTNESKPITNASEANDTWEDFLTSRSQQVAITQPLEFHDETFPASPTLDEMRWIQVTEDFPPTQNFHDDAVPASIEQPADSPSNTDLFGNDFQEEEHLAPFHHAGWTNPGLESPLTFEAAPSLAYEHPQTFDRYDIEMFDQLPDESAATNTAHETFEQPYADLLDTLSSANMSAMTFDPNLEVRKTSPVENYDRDYPFEGGLARQTRSSILSFADLQQNQSPVVSDDRDILIIEEDVPAYTNDGAFEPATPAVIHPYKQLFSKLRS
jgi:type II secretory pathway predicted ATPase ExeA